jgi:triosephosphate isomerase
LTELPVIVVNFKAYREVEGTGSLDIAGMCESVSKETGVLIAACPVTTELGYIARSVDIPVFSQNADPHSPGAFTGWVTPSMVKASGASGTLINHTEHKQSLELISETIKLCGIAGIVSLVCADTAELASRIAAHDPDIIAVEPPELIGGNVSVTDADPEIVRNTVRSVKMINERTAVFCGAGVKTGKDVKNALDLGADGVLLASGVVKAEDPRASLMDLVKYL